MPIVRALGDAGMAPEAIDEVLVVGGATRMPCVIRLATQVFGRMPLRNLPPDEAVAFGAAVQAALKTRDAAVQDLVVTDVATTTTERASNRIARRLTPVTAAITTNGHAVPAGSSSRGRFCHNAVCFVGHVFSGRSHCSWP